MSDMEVLNVVPRGEVNNIYSWESKEIQFYNGMVVHNRKRARAKKILSFVVYGKENMLVYLRDFYDRHHGLLDKFYFNYDGITVYPTWYNIKTILCSWHIFTH